MNVEFDYYKNVIDGLILKSPQSLSAGIPGNFINANVGSMYNRGIELGIQADIIQTKTFAYMVSGWHKVRLGIAGRKWGGR